MRISIEGEVAFGPGATLVPNHPDPPTPEIESQLLHVIQDSLSNLSQSSHFPDRTAIRADDYIVRTARNRVLPSTTRWYALGASANGYVSTIVLTFPRATKSRAS